MVQILYVVGYAVQSLNKWLHIGSKASATTGSNKTSGEENMSEKKVFKQWRKKPVWGWKEYEIRKKNDVPAKWKLLTLKEHLALHERWNLRSNQTSIEAQGEIIATNLGYKY